jgi:signal transduction histidine kinase
MLDRIGAALARREEAYESQRRFIADASHELKTPLTVVKGRVGAALHGPQAAGRYAEHMKSIGRAADSMSAIVTDLLLLAQSDEGVIRLCPRYIAAADLVEEAVAMAGLPRGQIAVEVPANLEVCVDPTLFVRMLTNLVTNAVRHCPPPGRMSVRAWKRLQGVGFAVVDEGEGIAAEHLPRLFEPFYRADPSRERGRGGTGLGLAIAKSVVEAHRGVIAVGSKLGSGTIVTIDLPCV